MNQEGDTWLGESYLEGGHAWPATSTYILYAISNLN